MLVNTAVTHYHKTIDKTTKLEKWERRIYNQTWLFGGKGARINKGYENANDVDIRIWYNSNSNLDIKKIQIGDIVVKGEVELNIATQQDLINYEFYNITSINDNNFGANPHIHIGGK